MFSSAYRNLFLIITLSFGLVACTGQTTDPIISSFPVPEANVSSDTEPLPDNTGVVTLNWTPPTENTDSSPLINLAGYKIHYGTTQGTMDNIITIPEPSLSTYMIENLQTNQTYYVAITSYNSNDTESEYSNINSITL